jgi:hypothetical protein
MAIEAGRLKHLEIIQQVITRMANNSFLLKGWSVTLIAALLAIAFKESSAKDLIWIAIIPCVMFWGLDGYFLLQEKLYREIWNTIAKENQDAPTDFRMKPTKDEAKPYCWLCATFSKTLIPFHGTLVSILFVVHSLVSGSALVT